jgi:hypothetical protein
MMRRNLKLLAAHRRIRNQLRLLVVLSTLSTATGCGDGGEPVGNGPQAGTFRGPTQTVANGTAQTFVTINEAGDPTSIGVIVSEGALSGLPATNIGTDLLLPVEAADTPFRGAALVWFPNGHPPPGLDVPHFDLHFFLIDQGRRNAIGPADPQFEQKGLQAPDAAFLPPDYLPAGGGGAVLPGFGRPWIDPTGPEFNGQPFTANFVYFFYEGRPVDLAIGVTTAFLQTKADFSSAIKLPAAFPEPGLYPVRYSVRFDATAGEYIVTLEGLTAR